MASIPVLHVIVPRYALTDFLFEPLHGREDLRLIEHPLRRHRLSNLLRAVEVYLLPWLPVSLHFDRAYVEQLRRIRPEDPVLFFAIENRKDLQIIRKFIPARRQSVWLWNPIRNYRQSPLSRLWYRHWMRRSGMQVCTFDADDAQANGFRLLDQVYRQVKDELDPAGDGPAAGCDVYFLGADKGRLDTLQSLKTQFGQAGIGSHFHIVPDKRKRYDDAQRAWLAPRWLSYVENLRQARGSRALLELLQETQSGATMRSMEAAFLDKKLITNNAALRDTPLYHPDRIFILGQDDIRRLRQFIESPLPPLDAAVLRGHDIEHWIRQFVEPGGAAAAEPAGLLHAAS